MGDANRGTAYAVESTFGVVTRNSAYTLRTYGDPYFWGQTMRFDQVELECHDGTFAGEVMTFENVVLHTGPRDYATLCRPSVYSDPLDVWDRLLILAEDIAVFTSSEVQAYQEHAFRGVGV